MLNDKTKLIEKVRKLLALSQSPNEHEAASAAERAQAILKTVRRRYCEHKFSAKHRNIAFLFTLDTWMTIWLKSGHWFERGRYNYEYCMARNGDKGIYELGNVKIITNLENRNSRRLSAKSRALISKGIRAHVRTAEHNANISRGNTGKKLSAETRAKMSIAQYRRQARERKKRKSKSLT